MNLCYLQYDCVVALSDIVAKQFVNRKKAISRCKKQDQRGCLVHRLTIETY